MFNISEAMPEDHAQIMELGKQFRLTPYTVDPQFIALTKVEIPMAISNKIFKTPSIKTLVAKLQGTVIGFVSFMYEDRLSNYLKLGTLDAPRCCSILFLAVDFKYRRHSVGSSLLKSCKNICQENGVELIRVATDYGNFPALNLYQKSGFKMDMNFHIYRVYKHELGSTLSPQIAKSMITPNTLAEPLEQAIKRRPVPWYYIPSLNKDHVEKFILDHLKDQIKNNKIHFIQKILFDKTIGVTIHQEKEKEIYYGLKGTIWTINDLLESGTRGEQLPIFLQHLLYNLPNFLMAEMYVNAADYDTQRILRDSNMNFVYGGISLNCSDLN